MVPVMGSRIRADRPLRDVLDRLGADEPQSARRRRVLGGALVVVALFGSNAAGQTWLGTWPEMWIGTEDLLQCAALIVTAFLLTGRSRMVAWAAAASVTLMLIGTVIDVMTIGGDGDSYVALAVSLVIKLPTVVVLAVLVRRGREW
ncbi:hypothetical protein ACIRST_14340 [Kitasatospora sp. NPDC101447]|uniref:hypothetical protein n=1 Tax=Kitasatospora sp. NPDC101447 TaxID=3364102 RepID=UPI0038057675